MIVNASLWGQLKDLVNHFVFILASAGTPVDGTDGANIAGKGSLDIDYTNAILYINTGTKASPVWTSIGGGSGGAGVTLTGTQTLTNKTLTNPVLNAAAGTLVVPTSASPAQTAEGSLVWNSGSDLLTVGDGASRKTMVDLAGTQTLSGKTLTAPVISTISNTGVITLPTSTDTLVGRATTDTLTNKTLTSPVINGATGNENVASITADGAITIQRGITLIAKAASAIAATLAAPGAGNVGVRMVLTTTTDFAHVITFTGGTLWDGTAGANNTWTSGAVQGSSLDIVAVSSTKWNVVGINEGTVAP